LKYDNYGYKPSQGLYNESYGTRGSDWDTPTWTTDPDYYEGKRIYDSNHGAGDLGGYTIDKRPKGMSKREFKALKEMTITNSKVLTVKKDPVSLIKKEINLVKNKYYKNPDGFRERLTDQITDYLKTDKSKVAEHVYNMLPDIK